MTAIIPGSASSFANRGSDAPLIHTVRGAGRVIREP